MTSDEVIGILKETRALLEGHFILRSGLHSRQFVQCAQALQFMPVVERLGGALADRVRELEIETVMAPAMGGLVLGQEVARQLKCRFLFVEKEEGRLVLRRGFKLSQGERVLVVEDVVTRGGRVQETLDIIKNHGGTPVAVAVMVDRSSGKAVFEVPFLSLVSLDVETFEADDLPADLKAIPAIKPGSK